MTTPLIPSRILDGILSGGCAILSNRQQGKTNLAKLIISEMVRQKFPVQCKTFDTAQVWVHSFLNSFKCQEINDNTQQVYNNGDNVLYDIEYADSERIMQFMGNIVYTDYYRMRAMKKASNGKLRDWILYTLEEAQNSLGSHSLSRQSGRFWLKAISEGANFHQAFILIGQRPADISARAIERMSTYFIGKITGDNNTQKLKRIVGRKAGEDTDLKMPLHEYCKILKRGQFVFWDGAEAWKFDAPKFEDEYPNQRPEMVKPERKRWIKLW